MCFPWVRMLHSHNMHLLLNVPWISDVSSPNCLSWLIVARNGKRLLMEMNRQKKTRVNWSCILKSLSAVILDATCIRCLYVSIVSTAAFMMLHAESWLGGWARIDSFSTSVIYVTYHTPGAGSTVPSAAHQNLSNHNEHMMYCPLNYYIINIAFWTVLILIRIIT